MLWIPGETLQVENKRKSGDEPIHSEFVLSVTRGVETLRREMLQRAATILVPQVEEVDFLHQKRYRDYLIVIPSLADRRSVVWFFTQALEIKAIK